MLKQGEKCKRLPVTFHRTFIPERQYIATLLRFAAGGGEGTDQEVSAQTGIPVGKSDGKVPAIVSYCSGMGLIQIKKGEGTGRRQFGLTPFGRAVLLEDCNLSEALTQWLVHFHLCRRQDGAEIWHLCFAKGYDVLGMEFSEDDLAAYMERICGKRNRSLIGPLVRTYEEPAGLKSAGVLVRSDGMIQRSAAPLLSGFRNGFAAFFLSLWEFCFPNDRQVTILDFETETYWQKIGGWDERQYEIILDMLQEAGVITVDKQMRPWVLSRFAEAKNFWPILYDDLA